MSLCGAMEFFLELALTITIPLLLTCFLSKLLSVAAAAEELAPVGFHFGFGSRIRKPSVVVADQDSVGGDGIVESKQDNSNSTGILESRCETESTCDDAVIGSVRTVDVRADSDSDRGGGDCGGEVAGKVIDKSSVTARSGDCGGEAAEKVFDEISISARSGDYRGDVAEKVFDESSVTARSGDYRGEVAEKMFDECSVTARSGDCDGEVAGKVFDESSVRARSGDCGGDVAEKVFDESSLTARSGDCGGEVAEKVFDESSVTARSGDCGGEVAGKVFHESSVRPKSEETGIFPSEGVEAFESDRSKEEGSAAEVEEIVDDWEGIERTELEKQFEAAVNFVKIHDSEDPNFGNELKMRLSGLHKIAMEGPCTEPPPMALKIFARFKWNAWKEMGNMSPEVAMESYINLVSGNIPGWKQTPSLQVNSHQDASHTHGSEKLVSKTESL